MIISEYEARFYELGRNTIVILLVNHEREMLYYRVKTLPLYSYP